MVSVSALLKKYAYQESGLSSLWITGRDAWLIIIARCCRMFAYGGSALILALFFNELEFSDSRIGLFLTLTLIGDVVSTWFLAWKCILSRALANLGRRTRYYRLLSPSSPIGLDVGEHSCLVACKYLQASSGHSSRSETSCGRSMAREEACNQAYLKSSLRHFASVLEFKAH